MIEEGFNEPILGEFSMSQANSIDSDGQETDMPMTSGGKRKLYLQKSDDSDSSVLEVKISRRQTKRHSVGGKRNCQSTTFENSSEAISINEFIEKSINNTKQEIYECSNCSLHPSPDCTICHGKQTVTESDSIVKFFVYVLEFKIGKRGNYTPTCNNITSKNISMTRSTNFQTRESRKSNRIQIEQKLAEIRNIHDGYFCDQCTSKDPIQGKRYHCQVCGDFDLCQQCFETHDHQHPMEIINYSNSYKHRIMSLFHLIKDHERMATAVKCTNAMKPKIHQSSIR